MKAYYQKPADRISNYVHEILVIEENGMSAPIALPLFANGMPTINFQTTKGRIKNQSNYITLFGQTICPLTFGLNDNFTLIAYFLKPHSLISLFDISAEELTDKPIDFNMLPHCKGSNLQEQLLNAGSTTEMIELLDQFLFNLASKNKTDMRSLEYATNKIVQNPNHQILRQVQQELCVTERTFQRMFQRKIGVSPNEYRRICQFHNAFQQLNRRRKNSLAEITFHNGYADQSHFIRSFKRFTHMTPTEYLNYGAI